MIVVIANVVLKDASDGMFVEAAQNCIECTRKEEGNISYNLFSNTEDGNKYSFVEEWESQAALDAHMKTPHFKEFGKAIGDLLAAALEIKVYEAEVKG